MKTKLILVSLLINSFSFAQNVADQLGTAIRKLETDAQFKHAILSMYVVDTKTGKTVFDKNGQIGLAPASCQKVVTSASAFEILGKDFKYKTELKYFGRITGSAIIGNFEISGYGDPSLGSWRFKQTEPKEIINRWINVLKKKKIKSLGNIITGGAFFSEQNIPGGWVWEDIGNYYGAGAASLNWRENQFDLFLKAGSEIGKFTNVVAISPPTYAKPFINEITTAAKGTGDNAYIFFPLDEFDKMWLLKGTIPLGENNFKISGAIKDPFTFLRKEFIAALDFEQIKYKDIKPENRITGNKLSDYNPKTFVDTVHTFLLDTYFSPPLDSLNYWFLKKSINLYGEAFVKTIAFEKKKWGDTDSGIAIIKDFWSKKGIEKSALNIIDGSGLSPANRVTTNALVSVMLYAKQQKWFSSFYNALPEMNGIKMKDGYISGVRSYTGYIKSKSGEEYTFSFIVNNFDGSPATAREKMWRVLDILK